MTIEAVTLSWDDVNFKLKEDHAFDWLRKLGRTFAVFDQQDSGNISFGVERDGEKLFVKYAGARTLRYEGEPEASIERLKLAMPLYESLRHPNLVNLVEHYEVGAGYVGVFEWFEGETLHPFTAFPPPAKYTHPDSPFYRFRQLSLELRLAALDSIFTFHRFVEARNYVAVDFYDGSILYDFKTNATRICDIDCYEQKPFFNHMGRLWGSSRFMSPEEFVLGAAIDGRTNVFNMGAMAFCLVGGERDRDYSSWEAGRDKYEVALRAVELVRDLRYASVAEFCEAWGLG
ncbi:MAG: kinase domain protein [Paenibacillus sp.]|nr:kinase domain protein [Paenibacillus sp.]